MDITPLAVAHSIAIAACGAGIGIGIIGGKAVESIGRQPEASGKIQSFAILSMVLAESTAIYGFLFAFLLYAKL